MRCSVRLEACHGPVDKHHIKTRKSGGSDEPFNLIPLCRKHHTEIHQIGSVTFIEKYHLQEIFAAKGWTIVEIFDKRSLRHEKSHT